MATAHLALGAARESILFADPEMAGEYLDIYTEKSRWLKANPTQRFFQSNSAFTRNYATENSSRDAYAIKEYTELFKKDKKVAYKKLLTEKYEIYATQRNLFGISIDDIKTAESVGVDVAALFEGVDLFRWQICINEFLRIAQTETVAAYLALFESYPESLNTCFACFMLRRFLILSRQDENVPIVFCKTIYGRKTIFFERVDEKFSFLRGELMRFASECVSFLELERAKGVLEDGIEYSHWYADDVQRRLAAGF